MLSYSDSDVKLANENVCLQGIKMPYRWLMIQTTNPMEEMFYGMM